MPIPNQPWQSLIYAGPNEHEEKESRGRGTIVTVGKCDLKSLEGWDLSHPKHSPLPSVRKMKCVFSMASCWEERASFLGFAPLCAYIHVRPRTNTVSHSDTHRHMYTVHTTHSASAWLIQRSIRSLTVTNSWLTAEHKKAHTLTPNLWGGLGQGRGLTYSSSRPPQLSPPYLLFSFSFSFSLCLVHLSFITPSLLFFLACLS